MDNKQQIPKPEESLEVIDMDATSSVDDFIKELEAKEKDLHITADLTIEIEQSEFDPRNTPDFVPHDLAASSPQPSVPKSSAQELGAKTRIYELRQEVESLNARLAALRGERNEVQEKSDRRLKDFENYKYRMDRERRGSFIDQITNLASQMLPVLDNLDRALASVEGVTTKKGEDFQQFYDGIGLVNQQVNEIFSGMGVQPIATLGETFDPNFHEAVSVEECTETPPNTITGEILRGYRIGNRVIRHSMVKVTTAPQATKKGRFEKEDLELPDAPPPVAADESDDILPHLSDPPGIDASLPEAD